MFMKDFLFRNYVRIKKNRTLNSHNTLFYLSAINPIEKMLPFYQKPILVAEKIFYDVPVIKVVATEMQ